MREQERLAYLSRLGIDVWMPRLSDRAEVAPGPETEAVASGIEPEAPLTSNVVSQEHDASAGPSASAALDALSVEVSSCTRCKLHSSRRNTVFGVGAADARCMIIGEGPGAEEDARGEPFVGRAGKLLDAMLAAIGVAREAVYIANIVKCRPPGNRDPQADEVAACGGYLRQQIRLVRPEIMVAVGRVAAQQLLESTAPVGRMRGRIFPYTLSGPEDSADQEQIPVLVTYHPAYLLRSPGQKAKAWEDLKQLKRRLENIG